jgi:hypothetical protein
MTQHILIIWLATAVATFFALVGSTTKGAASTVSAPRAVQDTRGQMALLGSALRAVGLLMPKDEAPAGERQGTARP